MTRAEKIIKTADELKYLSEEYASKTIWGSRNGDVIFSGFVEYLSKPDNFHFIEHLLKVVKEMEDI